MKVRALVFGDSLDDYRAAATWSMRQQQTHQHADTEAGTGRKLARSPLGTALDEAIAFQYGETLAGMRVVAWGQR
jgi:hypothetical protein